jgi:hypothetical protein
LRSMKSVFVSHALCTLVFTDIGERAKQNAESSLHTDFLDAL